MSLLKQVFSLSLKRRDFFHNFSCRPIQTNRKSRNPAGSPTALSDKDFGPYLAPSEILTRNSVPRYTRVALFLSIYSAFCSAAVLTRSRPILKASLRTVQSATSSFLVDSYSISQRMPSFFQLICKPKAAAQSGPLAEEDQWAIVSLLNPQLKTCAQLDKTDSCAACFFATERRISAGRSQPHRLWPHDRPHRERRRGYRAQTKKTSPAARAPGKGARARSASTASAS